jgi:hypothetical protein
MIQVLSMEVKINFSLMQLLSQISQMLYGKSTLCDYVRLDPSHRNPFSHFPNKEKCQKVRNSIKMNHLPLMIFICWHSQVSILDNKSLFCSIMSLFMSKNLLFVCAFCPVIRMQNVRALIPDK